MARVIRIGQRIGAVVVIEHRGRSGCYRTSIVLCDCGRLDQVKRSRLETAGDGMKCRGCVADAVGARVKARLERVEVLNGGEC